MERSAKRITEDLRAQSMELQQSVRQIDSVRSMLAYSWSGDASDEFCKKLWDIIQKIDHAGTEIRSISDSLEEKVVTDR